MIFSAVVVFGIGFFTGYHYKNGKMPVESTTEIVYDTINYYSPVPKDSLVIHYETRKLPTAGKEKQPTTDSVEVEIPIVQNVYEDSTYKAWVSGYDVRLDSVRIINKTEIITNTIKQKKKPWGIGIGVGYGVGAKGISPFVGITLSYNLFEF